MAEHRYYMFFMLFLYFYSRLFQGGILTVHDLLNHLSGQTFRTGRHVCHKVVIVFLMVALLTDFLQFFCLFSDNQIHWTLIAYTGSGRNQLTDDNVLLQTNQVILFTLDCGIGQNLCGFLEGCGRQEGICFNRRLGYTQQYRFEGSRHLTVREI